MRTDEPLPSPAPSLSTCHQKSSCSRRVLPEIRDGRTPPWTLCSALGNLTPGATAPLPALFPASAPRSLHVGVTAASSLVCLTPRQFRGGALVPEVAMCTHPGSTCAQGGQQKHPSPHPALWSSWLSAQSLESVAGTLAPPHSSLRPCERCLHQSPPCLLPGSRTRSLLSFFCSPHLAASACPT